METLHAEIDQLEASIAKLTEDITALTKAVAELDAAMAKATSLRQAEKKTNTETIADSQEAQTAVAQALTVLKEFYAKAAESTAFAQTKYPEIFEDEYKGMQSSGGGVVGMLQQIIAEAKQLEADAIKAESDGQKAYETYVKDTNASIEEKSRDITNKSSEKAGAEADKVAAEEDKETAMNEQQQLMNENADLHKSCDFTLKNFDIRQTAQIGRASCRERV